MLAPHVVKRMLTAKHGTSAMAGHATKNESVRAQALAYDAAMTRGEVKPIYQFGEGVPGGDDIDLADKEIRIPGYEHPIRLEFENPFADMSG